MRIYKKKKKKVIRVVFFPPPPPPPPPPKKEKFLRTKLQLPEEKLLACSVNPKDRAENLTVEQWFCLAKIINQTK